MMMVMGVLVGGDDAADVVVDDVDDVGVDGDDGDVGVDGCVVGW
jgi:hypothetical protein